MKHSMNMINVLLMSLLFSTSSCTTEGEAISGIWNTSGSEGQMQIEMTPWKGKFVGYLLKYQNGGTSITNAKTKEHIFITDLEYKANQYQNGKIYLNPGSETYCDLSLEWLNEHQLTAIYNCEGQNFEEVWSRKGFPAQTTSSQEEPTMAKEKEETAGNTTSVVEQKMKVQTSPSSPKAPSTAPQLDADTKKRTAFNVIGMQKSVKYDDFKAMEKAIETLWTKLYEQDFSEKLTNINATNQVYLTYTNYDQPKGMMTITLGYSVKKITEIPKGLKAQGIPANEYLTYSLSGEKSDFTGEGWTQLETLMPYRKENSADFEVYTFDANSYQISKAEMWIATQ